MVLDPWLSGCDPGWSRKVAGGGAEGSRVRSAKRAHLVAMRSRFSVKLELRIFHDLFASEASRQLNALGIATTQSEGDVVEYNRSQLESSIIDGANQTVVGPGTPATPLPDPSTLSFGSESIVGSLFDTPGPAIEEPTFGEHEPAPAPDLPSDEPAT